MKKASAVGGLFLLLLGLFFTSMASPRRERLQEAAQSNDIAPIHREKLEHEIAVEDRRELFRQRRESYRRQEQRRSVEPAKEAASGSILCVPNPASETPCRIQIELGAKGGIVLQISNTSGDVVYQANIAEPQGTNNNGQGPLTVYEHVWDISTVPSGVYVIRAHGENNSQTIDASGKCAVIH